MRSSWLSAMIPVASLAENVDGLVNEAAAMRKLDNAWAALDAAEADALAQGMSRTEVINAVYTAALNLNTVDKDSFSDFTKDGFYFTVDGMYCAYNYRLRNELGKVTEPANDGIFTIKGSGSNAAMKDAESPNVLLLGPYYGYDSNFDDSYKNATQPIAEATGGDWELIQGHAATGPAIVEAFPDYGSVFVDSHGTASGSSTYICLTTNEGITQEDYNNGWAVNSGSAAYIDGRYIQHHLNGAHISNPFVWLGICEGMKLSGHGVTANALVEAGCGAVYGYSQSVTFVADLTMYLPSFTGSLMEGATIADAFQTMKDEYGVPDPRGDAYPIIVSPVDPYPANPDSEQTVYCEWTLFGNAEPVDITGFSLDTENVEIYVGKSAAVMFNRVPDNANNYEIVWTSSNESVATVTGNKRRATVTGISAGTATITCTVMVNGEVFGSANVAVTVNVDTTLMEALNVEGGALQFGTSEPYGFEAVTEGDRLLAKSNNASIGNSTATLTTTVQMAAGDTLTFDYYYSSENNYDWYRFKANGTEVQKLSGTGISDFASYTYTAASDGAYTFEWSYSKDSSVNGGNDCVKLDNVAFSGTIEPPAPELNEVAFTISADGVRFGDVATVSVDCAPVTAPQIAHRGRIEINFPTAFVGGGLGIYAELIPGELLERIEAAGGTYTLGINELEPIESTGHGRYPESIFVEFECAAGVEMSGNLFNYTATVSNTFGSETFPFEVELTIYSSSLTYIENGVNYEVPVSVNNSVFEVAPRLGDVNLDGSVTIADALEVMRHAIEVLTLDGASLEAADVNGDGVIGLPDAILIARIAMGL
ncbi:MAG: Ig-like domain-containing protein [Christensenellales bacterium]